MNIFEQPYRTVLGCDKLGCRPGWRINRKHLYKCLTIIYMQLHTHTKSMRANIRTDARHANGCAHRQIDLHTVHTVPHHTTIPKYHRIPHHAIEINSSCSLIDLIGDFCILFPCCFAEDHMQFLLSLPEGLVRELFHEARSLTLAYHPFFMEIGNVNRTMELNLCNQAVQELYLLEKLC